MADNLFGILGRIVGVTSTIFSFIFIIYVIAGDIKYLYFNVLPYLGAISDAFSIICLILFLPISFFKKTRFVSSMAFLILCFLTGLCNNIIVLYEVNNYFGYVFVFISIFITYMGAFPFVLIAMMLDSKWHLVFDLIMVIAIQTASGIYSAYLLAKHDRE